MSKFLSVSVSGWITETFHGTEQQVEKYLLELRKKQEHHLKCTVTGFEKWNKLCESYGKKSAKYASEALRQAVGRNFYKAERDIKDPPPLTNSLGLIIHIEEDTLI